MVSMRHLPILPFSLQYQALYGTRQADQIPRTQVIMTSASKFTTENSNTKMYDVSRVTGGRRMRRNRHADWSRRLIRENALSVNDLIWPIFVMDGDNLTQPIGSMPGVDRLSIDNAVRAAESAAKLGIPVIALFPYTDPALRDDEGSEALNENNLICRALRAIKKEVPEIGLMTDVALDPYTSHGHDGLLRDGIIVNDETVARELTRQALVQAEAGSDIIGPSDMMGRSRWRDQGNAG